MSGGGGEEEEEAMASGWGINGNKGRCYDFWLDFSSCMSRCRQPSDCGLLREDYLECLHHSKEVPILFPLLPLPTPRLSPRSDGYERSVILPRLIRRRNADRRLPRSAAAASCDS